MPNFDGTGPNGLGSMTGGGRGFCAAPAGSVRPAGYGWRTAGWVGRGGGGGGGGRGWRKWYYATGLTGWQRSQFGYPAGSRGYGPYAPNITAQDEARMLKEQAGELEQMLADIKSRISELAAEGPAREDKKK